MSLSVPGSGCSVLARSGGRPSVFPGPVGPFWPAAAAVPRCSRVRFSRFQVPFLQNISKKRPLRVDLMIPFTELFGTYSGFGI